MSARPLAEVYEELKELRRQGEPEQSIHQLIADTVASIRASLTDAKVPELSRFLEIKTLADRIFGDENKAEAWLQRPNRSLSGQRPYDLLKDDLGTAVVREMLERIDNGIFA